MENSSSSFRPGGHWQRKETTDARTCCRHSIPLCIQTSGTKKNPMRRFMSCPFRGDESCGYFVWCEPQLEGRAREVAIQCIEKIDRCKCEVDLARKGEQKWKKNFKVVAYVGISLLVVLVCVIRMGKSRGKVCSVVRYDTMLGD